jgi:AAA15 family ATPase/GTPase
MIINFSVQNFGSIKDKQTLSFEADKSTHLENHYIINATGGLRLLKLALIYGANASGKTTVLKAIEFLRDLVLEPADKKTDSLDFSPFLFDAETPKQNTIISIDFIQNEVRYFYEVELNKNAILREELNFYHPNKANVFKRTTNIDKQFTEITFGSKIKKDKIIEKILEANTLWNNTVLGGFLKTNIDIKELKEVTDWFEECLAPIVLTNTAVDDYITNQIESSNINKKNVVPILKKADFNISDIVINKEEKRKITSLNIEFEHTVNQVAYSLPIEMESQGTKRFYGFAGLLSLLIKHFVVIPIDELEASLHPDLYIHFLLSFLINSKKSQLIATTHNREILSNKDIFRNDAIWFTDKSENSATELYSLSEFDTSVVRDTSNIFNAYKTGKLGGTPNLGDYYINIDDEKN